MKIVTAMLYGGYVILMSRVKDIRLKVIPSNVANDFIKKHHYSGRVAMTSMLHFGCFLDKRIHGVMSFGNPLDKGKVIGLVNGAKWNEMLEINRMAFDDFLPKYSESRCLAIAIRLIKKHAPHIKWILSYADATMCGDGTIYRASGFVLTQINKNSTIWKTPSGLTFAGTSMTAKGKNASPIKVQAVKSDLLNTTGQWVEETGASSMKGFRELGCSPVVGFQIRYIYLIDKTCEITVPILPFSKIKEMGASMYKGEKLCDVGVKRSTASFQDVGGGAIPTTSLHLNYA
jgi:hypothetical protein